MTLDRRLAAFEQVYIPVWVIDIERRRMAWGNPAAVEFWRARDLADLQQRDLSDMSEATRARLYSLVESCQHGQQPAETWTIYPLGRPATVLAKCFPVELDDGRMALGAQIISRSHDIDPNLLRAFEVLRHTAALIALLDRDENILLQNRACASTFASITPCRQWFVGDAVPAALTRAIREGQTFTGEVIARTLHGERCHAIEIRRVKDPATGADVVLVHQVDIALIEAQRQQIRAMSAPIIDIGEHTIAVPIIGELDSGRSEDLANRLLREIAERRATHVILDLTGAATLDAASKDCLHRMLRSVALLGARPILTGIRPTLALAMVGGDADLGGITILSTLQEGLKFCAEGRREQAHGRTAHRDVKG